MAGPARPASSLATKRSGLRQPTTRRAGSAVPERRGSTAVLSRPTVPSATPVRSARPSPGLSNGESKRKEPNYEREINEDTSIHVVVRCRGRNDREIKENSGVVLATEGVSGKQVDLSMGPNAVSNKTYGFDRVFSPAADQTIVFEESVLPVVNEVCICPPHLNDLKVLKLFRCSLATTALFSHTARLEQEKHTQCQET